MLGTCLEPAQSSFQTAGRACAQAGPFGDVAFACFTAQIKNEFLGLRHNKTGMTARTCYLGGSSFRLRLIVGVSGLILQGPVQKAEGSYIR
jgi:hypothetical protein